MAPPLKLTDEQVKKIRRRFQRGEQLTTLAAEHQVDRKTLRRRIDALEQEEAERAERIAAGRLAKQAAAERRKLKAMLRVDPSQGATPAEANPRQPHEPAPRRDPYHEWLDTPKNLSGAALTRAYGLVRVRNPAGTVRQFVEESKVGELLDQGWTIDQASGRTPRRQK